MSEGTERLLLTGTLPGSTQMAFRALAEFSSTATKLLTNWLTYHEPKCKWQYVWEFQGRGALHLHLVCELGSVASQYVKEHFRDQWDRVLTKIGALANTNLYQKTSTYTHTKEKLQADVTVCEREPSRYISKYIAKNNTSAKGFNRFPPQQWFQVSRSLLRSLRDQTQVYEREGLSYRQALCFIEEGKSVLANYALSGERRFEGSVLAWSGYGYTPSFDIQEWSEKMTLKGYNLSPSDIIAKHAVSVFKDYPQLRCWATPKGLTDLMTASKTVDLSETELLLLIEGAMDLITLKWDSLNTKTNAARFMLRATSWWLAKFGYSKHTPEFREELVKICDDSLTSQSVRTKTV